MLINDEFSMKEVYGDAAIAAVRKMEEIITAFNNPDVDMHMSYDEFSAHMHEALNCYDDNVHKVKLIYAAEFSRLCG